MCPQEELEKPISRPLDKQAAHIFDELYSEGTETPDAVTVELIARILASSRAMSSRGLSEANEKLLIERGYKITITRDGDRTYMPPKKLDHGFLKFAIVAPSILCAMCIVAGVIFGFLRLAGRIDIQLFDQKITTTSVSVGALFLGVVLFIITFNRVMRSHDRQYELLKK